MYRPRPQTKMKLLFFFQMYTRKRKGEDHSCTHTHTVDNKRGNFSNVSALQKLRRRRRRRKQTRNRRREREAIPSYLPSASIERRQYACVCLPFPFPSRHHNKKRDKTHTTFTWRRETRERTNQPGQADSIRESTPVVISRREDIQLYNTTSKALPVPPSPPGKTRDSTRLQKNLVWNVIE